MSNDMTTEDILWKSIKDIESGNVKTIKEDPVNGFIKGDRKNLTKRNVCSQSAKYNNGKAISRPTLDSYKDISEYIIEGKKCNDSIFLKEENKKLKEQLNLANKLIKQLQENNHNLANENYKLNERLKDKFENRIFN